MEDMKYLHLLIFMMLLGINLSAQNLRGTITGKVVDEVTNEPIPGVNIVIVGSQKGAAADLNGEFVISNLDAGIYQVRVSALGYSTIIKSDVIVNNAKPTSLLLKMVSTLIELEGVTVRSGYFEMDPSEIGSVANLSYEECREDLRMSCAHSRFCRVLLRRVPEETI